MKGQRSVVSYADGVKVGNWLLDKANQGKFANKGFEVIAQAIKDELGIDLTAGAIRFKAQALDVDAVFRSRGHASGTTDKVIHALEESTCLLGERIAKLETRLAYIEKELGI